MVSVGYTDCENSRTVRAASDSCTAEQAVFYRYASQLPKKRCNDILQLLEDYALFRSENCSLQPYCRPRKTKLGKGAP